MDSIINFLTHGLGAIIQAVVVIITAIQTIIQTVQITKIQK